MSDILEEEVMEEIRSQTDAVKQLATDIRAQNPLVTPGTLGALNRQLSRKSATIFGQGTTPEPSTPHIGREVALVARTAAFVYI